MIDTQKLIEAADHHIKRGDNMDMDPQVVRQLAVRIQDRDETIAEEIAGMVRINPHIALSKSGEPIFTSPEEGLEEEFPECPHCGGTGLEVVSKTEIATQPDSVNERLLSAAEKYFTGYCQDEASAFGAQDTGCTDDQHKDAAELRDAIAAAKAEASNQPAPDFLDLLAQALPYVEEGEQFNKLERKGLSVEIRAAIKAALAKHGVQS